MYLSTQKFQNTRYVTPCSQVLLLTAVLTFEHRSSEKRFVQYILQIFGNQFIRKEEIFLYTTRKTLLSGQFSECENPHVYTVISNVLSELYLFLMKGKKFNKEIPFRFGNKVQTIFKNGMPS